MSENHAEAVQILLKLKSIVVPRCVHSGELIAFIAYKDQLIDEALARLNPTTLQPLHAVPQLICVDHQQLANTVIERTFDDHLKFLRERLKAAEDEARAWKLIAGGGSLKACCEGCQSTYQKDNLSNPTKMSRETQTQIDNCSPFLVKKEPEALLEVATLSAVEWMGASSDLFNSIEGQKLSLVTSAFTGHCTNRLNTSMLKSNSPYQEKDLKEGNLDAPDAYLEAKIEPSGKCETVKEGRARKKYKERVQEVYSARNRVKEASMHSAHSPFRHCLGDTESAPLYSIHGINLRHKYIKCFSSGTSAANRNEDSRIQGLPGIGKARHSLKNSSAG